MNFIAKTTSEETMLEKENRKIALEAAVEGMVLLENDGILPLSEEIRKIALFGNGARKTVKGGTGSGDVNERRYVTVEDGLRAEGYEIVTKSWLDAYDRIWEQDRIKWKEDLGKIAEEQQIPFVIAYLQTLHLLPAKAVMQADLVEADAAVYVIARRSGEGVDRVAQAGDYYLYEEEKEALRLLKGFYGKVVVVINAGGPVDTTFINEEIAPSALLVMSQAGSESGTALAGILSGKWTPSGKLTDTWALSYADYPEAENFSVYSKNPHEILYREGIYVGYRYFSTVRKKAAYSFGFGKSYTDFSIECTGYQTADIGIELDFCVKNLGGYSGKEVVQVYLKAPQGHLQKPARVLTGFVKTKLLEPGEETHIKVICSLDSLSSFDEKKERKILEAGDYYFFAGSSLDCTKPVLLMKLPEEICLEEYQSICPVRQPLEELCPEILEESFDCPNTAVLTKDVAERMVDAYRRQKMDYREYDLPKEDLKKLKRESTENLISLVVGAADEEKRSTVGNASAKVPGAAGETSSCINGVGGMVMADGGSGLRLLHHFQTEQDGKIIEQDGMAALERGAFAKPLPEREDAVDYYQYCTAFPIGTLLAQTWNEEILRKVGVAVGKEMQEFGVHIWLAPSINIHRNPLCGRNFEYYSEDPLLTGVLAASVCAGVQESGRVTVTIKHFAANNQELFRHSSDSIVSERTLREIYLKPFELVVKNAHPLAIMTSYNKVNGVQAANCKDLCTTVARHDWGFDGLIMTDWGTTDPGDSDPVVCVKCGNDLIMPGGIRDRKALTEALEEGRLHRQELELAASHIVGVARRLRG